MIRPRHLVTETDRIARALDHAASRWPEDSGRGGKLLLHLVEHGHQALLDESEDSRRERRAAIRRTSGALTGTYDTDYHERLRDDWPA